MKGSLQQIHPVLPVKNVIEALHYYVEKLGFTVAFADDDKNPGYAGVRRDNIELHLQWHDPKEWGTIGTPSIRIVTNEIEALYAEYKSQDVFHKNTALKETPWGTKEFAFFDPYMNGLTFYRDL